MFIFRRATYRCICLERNGAGDDDGKLLITDISVVFILGSSLVFFKNRDAEISPQ